MAASPRGSRLRGAACLPYGHAFLAGSADTRTEIDMEMLFYAHSGLRYLVLLAGIIAVVYYLYAIGSKKGNERTGRVLGSVFVATLDLQVLIGVLQIVFGVFYSALIGHLVMMIAAAVVAHVAMVMAKSSPTPERAVAIRLIGVVFALALIAGGIMAIGRSIFGAGVPSVG